MKTENLKLFGVKIMGLVIVGSLLYVSSPLFQPLVYHTLNSFPAFIMLGIPTVIGLVLYLSPPLSIESEDKGSIGAKLGLFGVIVAMLLVIGIVSAPISHVYEQRTLATETMDQGDSIDELPKINTDNPRIVPKAVSDVQSSGSVSYSQHQLGSSDIARTPNGSLAWTYPIEPDQFRNQISNNQRGVLYSDMTQMESRDITAYDQHQFKYGSNMLLHRGAKWNVIETDYWASYDSSERVEFIHNGNAYMAYPKVSHEWKFLPFPHTVPRWDGVALVHQDGTIENFTPEEARNSTVLDGQRLYPLSISEERARSLSYRNGILNVMPIIGTQENVVVPSEIPSSAENTQPFVIDMEDEEMAYIYTMGPPGSGTGLSEVLFFDSQTGEMRYFESNSSTLYGPDRAMGIVRSEDSQTGWGDNFVVLEPIPVVRNNTLWWHMKVSPTDFSDITRNVFVNTDTGESVAAFNTQGVNEFLGGADSTESELLTGVGEDSSVDAEPSDEDGIAYEIVIYDEDGTEVDRIPIAQNESVDIDVREPTQESEITPTPSR